MIPIRPQEIRHKATIIKLLKAIADAPMLTKALRFKGGTCAALSGFLDRFSVDVDFDFLPGFDKNAYRKEFHSVFETCGFRVDEESRRVLSFTLKYDSPPDSRNTLKVDALDIIWKANVYEPRFFPEIHRTFISQTRETIVSNKLVTPFDRYRKHRTVAGRDFYDIHTFLLRGYGYIPKLLKERTGKAPERVFTDLISFTKRHLTDRTINEDLNVLLPPKTFQSIRRSLKDELITLLHQEAARA